jgi:hypothetical protein
MQLGRGSPKRYCLRCPRDSRAAALGVKERTQLRGIPLLPAGGSWPRTLSLTQRVLK